MKKNPNRVIIICFSLAFALAGIFTISVYMIRVTETFLLSAEIISWASSTLAGVLIGYGTRAARRSDIKDRELSKARERIRLVLQMITEAGEVERNNEGVSGEMMMADKSIKVLRNDIGRISEKLMKMGYSDADEKIIQEAENVSDIRTATREIVRNLSVEEVENLDRLRSLFEADGDVRALIEPPEEEQEEENATQRETEEKNKGKDEFRMDVAGEESDDKDNNDDQEDASVETRLDDTSDS